MKTVGIIGGMSWESTTHYYELLNKGVKEKLGGLHSAKVIITSVDFHDIEELQRNNEWLLAAQILGNEARKLEDAGADYVFLATNTMHKVADFIESKIDVPFVHLADATAEAIQKQGYNKVALLGTKYTMEEDFYKGRLETHGLEVITPNKTNRNEINRIIFDELCLGKLKTSSKETFKQATKETIENGAEAVILGCTEISMLFNQNDITIPTFDTTEIHVQKALELMLG